MRAIPNVRFGKRDVRNGPGRFYLQKGRGMSRRIFVSKTVVFEALRDRCCHPSLEGLKREGLVSEVVPKLIVSELVGGDRFCNQDSNRIPVNQCPRSPCLERWRTDVNAETTVDTDLSRRGRRLPHKLRSAVPRPFPEPIRRSLRAHPTTRCPFPQVIAEDVLRRKDLPETPTPKARLGREAPPTLLG